MNGDTVWQLLRYVLLAVGGFFVSKGRIDNDTLTSIVAGLGTLFTALWGVYVKFNTKAVPSAVADKPSIPTVSSATGAIKK